MSSHNITKSRSANGYRGIRNLKKGVSFALFTTLLTGGVAFAGPEIARVADQNTHFTRFSDAKKALYRVSARLGNVDLYCGCDFDQTHAVEPEGCGYVPRRENERGKRVEAEHIVPASRLCGNTREWQIGSPECIDSKGRAYKGRKCATRYNTQCIRAHNDLHNLRPALGELNGDRKDYRYGEVSGEPRNYGQCDFEISNKTAEPADTIRGDIARIWLFMGLAYPRLILLEKSEKDLFQHWSDSDPVDKRECDWNREIEKEQGTLNIITAQLCKAAGL